MTYFRVDDRLHSHSKAMRAGTEAMGLWVLAGSWCMSQLTDGWVPDHMLARIAGGDPTELAESLRRAGLWHREDRDGEGGWLFHEWDDWQHSREYLERRRADAAERMRRARARGGDVRANGEGTSQVVTPTPTQPNPTTNTTARKRAASTTDDDPAWASFWAEYPRKTGKGAARKAWAGAVKAAGGDTAAIIAGATTYARQCATDGTEARFIAHPSTWLRAERWTDEQPTSSTTTDTGGQRSTPPAPPADVADDPAAYKAWLLEQRRAGGAA